jgi:hypothetical protein
MDPATALRLCDEILDFSEGWLPRLDSRPSSPTSDTTDVQAHVQSIREWIIYNNRVTTRQAEVLNEWHAWVRQTRQQIQTPLPEGTLEKT